MPSALIVSGLLASLLVAPVAGQLADDPSMPADPVKIRVVSILGSGCPDKAHVTASVSQDNTAFTITYGPEHRATVGVGAGLTDFRKNCQLSVNFKTPAGFTFAFSANHASSRGALVAGATGTVRWLNYSAGQTSTAYESRTFRGPLDGPWTVGAVIAPEVLVWYPCGHDIYVNFNTEVRAAAGTSDKATTSSISLESQTYDVIWSPCKWPWPEPRGA